MSYKILNKLDKSFKDEEDIKKDKELYENYNNNLSSDYLSTNLDPKIISKDIIDSRKNHNIYFNQIYKLFLII